ncbi:MAG: NusG domain II-containing protein [Firmicutes bacterium]|nr:NusG domain II-containing protein [Bacillota bacterium]
MDTNKQDKILRIRDGRIFGAGDIVLFAVLAAALAALFIAVYGGRKPGDTVYVYTDNQLVCEFSLNEDTIQGIDSRLTLVIKDGKVSVKDSKCPDHICETRSISYKGEQIICLPNRILIEIGERDPFGPQTSK